MITTEQSLIGMMLEYPHRIPDVLSRIKRNDFAGELSKKVFSRISSRYGKSEDASLYTLGLEEIETHTVEDWRDSVVSEAGFRDTLAYVQDQGQRLRLGMAVDTLQDALKGGESIDVVLRYISEMQAILDRSEDEKPVLISKAVEEALEQSTERIKSGLATLDSLVQMQRGQLGIVAARPGVGKSSLARLIAIVVSNKHRVIFNSNEMSMAEVSLSTMSSILRIDSGRVQRQQLTENEKDRIKNSSKVFDLRLSEYTTPREIEKHIRANNASSEKKIALVVVDYIQLLSSGEKTSNRTEEVSKITRQLKVIAQKYNVLIIALSQFSRAGVEKPELHHLRESGSIEQDANWVLAIDNVDGVHDEKRLILLKNRSGSIGERSVRWNADYTLFEDLGQ